MGSPRSETEDDSVEEALPTDGGVGLVTFFFLLVEGAISQTFKGPRRRNPKVFCCSACLPQKPTIYGDDGSKGGGKGKRSRQRGERGGNPARPGLLRWQAKQDGRRLPNLDRLPRGEGHLPLDARTDEGMRRHHLDIVAALTRKRPTAELGQVLDMMASIDTLDTFKGYQGRFPSMLGRFGISF